MPFDAAWQGSRSSVGQTQRDGDTTHQIDYLETDHLSHQTIIIGVRVLLEHPGKPIKLTWQNSTFPGMAKNTQVIQLTQIVSKNQTTRT